MSEIDIAWAAGIIDGEGWVAVQSAFDKKRGRSYPKPFIVVGMTHEETILKLYEIFGVGSLSSPKWPDKPQYTGRKQTFRWSTANRKALEVAQRIAPYMVTKREAVAMILANYDVAPTVVQATPHLAC